MKRDLRNAKLLLEVAFFLCVTGVILYWAIAPIYFKEYTFVPRRRNQLLMRVDLVPVLQFVLVLIIFIGYKPMRWKTVLRSPKMLIGNRSYRDFVIGNWLSTLSGSSINHQMCKAQFWGYSLTLIIVILYGVHFL